MTSMLALTLLLSTGDFTVISDTETRKGALKRTETIIQLGDDELHRFGMHRVRSVANLPPKAILLLSPPLGGSFNFYEISKSGQLMDSFAGFMAHMNVEVWGYSPPTAYIPAGACEDNSVDCSVMSDWGIDAVVSGLEIIRSFIASARPNTPVIIGGHSLGAITALVALGRAPTAYKGALISEGVLRSNDPEIVALNEALCAQYDGAVAAGATFGALTPVKGLAALAAANPNGASPAFPGLTNKQALVALFADPTLSPILNVPDFVSLAGNISSGNFTFANNKSVQAMASGFNEYFPLKQLADVSCSLANQRDYVGALGSFTGRVYTIEAGLGFGPYMNDTLSLIGSNRITRTKFAPAGHIDPWTATIHMVTLELPVYAWILTVH